MVVGDMMGEGQGCTPRPSSVPTQGYSLEVLHSVMGGTNGSSRDVSLEGSTTILYGRSPLYGSSD